MCRRLLLMPPWVHETADDGAEDKRTASERRPPATEVARECTRPGSDTSNSCEGLAYDGMKRSMPQPERVGWASLKAKTTV